MKGNSLKDRGCLFLLGLYIRSGVLWGTSLYPIASFSSMGKLLAFLTISQLFITGFLYAAPVDVSTEIQGLEGNIFRNKELGIGLSIAGEADFLGKRKLDIAGKIGTDT